MTTFQDKTRQEKNDEDSRGGYIIISGVKHALKKNKRKFPPGDVIKMFSYHKKNTFYKFSRQLVQEFFRKKDITPDINLQFRSRSVYVFDLSNCQIRRTNQNNKNIATNLIGIQHFLTQSTKLAMLFLEKC